MRLPLNIPYSVGTDLAFAPRFLALDTPNWARFQKLSRRLLTDTEYKSFESRHKFHEVGELSSGSANRAQAIVAARNYVAGRWAAKEAAMKAWGADLLSPQQLQVDVEKDGRPTIHCFLPEDVDASDEQITSQEANLAISHDGEYATAVVIARPLHPELRKAFVKLRLEGRSRVAGKPKAKTEIDDSKRDFFPKDDPAFNNIIDLDNIRASGADNVLEVGNLGGYSAIWMASAGPQVYSTTVEVDTHHNAVAKRSIANAGLSSQIDVLLGCGTKVLAKLQPEIAAGQRKLFDWVFIDADKQNDLACLQMVLEMTEPATTFFIDDVVRSGELADRKAAKKDDRVRATREQVEAIGKDERVTAVVVQPVTMDFSYVDCPQA